MMEGINASRGGKSYNLVSIGWGSYKYKTVFTLHAGRDDAESGWHGGAFDRRRLLHRGLDGREGSVVFFLAESGT